MKSVGDQEWEGKDLPPRDRKMSFTKFEIFHLIMFYQHKPPHLRRSPPPSLQSTKGKCLDLILFKINLNNNNQKKVGVVSEFVYYCMAFSLQHI